MYMSSFWRNESAILCSEDENGVEENANRAPCPELCQGHNPSHQCRRAFKEPSLLFRVDYFASGTLFTCRSKSRETLTLRFFRYIKCNRGCHQARMYRLALCARRSMTV